MPRPRHAQGRPGTQVIPADWQQTHRPVVEQAHAATCAIHSPTGGSAGTFDKTTGKYDGRAPSAPFYDGPCSVAPLSAVDTTALAADENVPLAGYRVTIPLSAPAPAADDVVIITAVGANADPALVGRVLTVRGYATASAAWERVVTCTENQS